MGVKENIATVRADVANQSQNFFIYFFKKFPQHMKHFSNYAGKSPDSLKSVGAFPGHVQKVVAMLLDVAERSGDKAALAADASKLVKMQQHAKLTTVEFQDLFTALVGYLGTALGGACDKAGWEATGKNVVAALKTAGMA